jgi:hypothetical protein
MIVNDFAYMCFCRFSGRLEMAQCLGNRRWLDAIAEFYTAISAGMQNLLDSDRPVGFNHLSHSFETGDIFIIINGQLIVLGFAFTLGIGLSALVGNYATAGSGYHFVACKLAVGEKAFPVIKI